MSIKLEILDGEKKSFEDDLEVEGSIINSRLYIRGSLKTTQILNSELFVLGDIKVRDVVQKSKIFCKKLLGPGARVRTSDIYVENLMEVKEAGTFPPTPLSIYLGYRINLVKEYLKVVEEEKKLLKEREMLSSSISYLSFKVPKDTKGVEKAVVKVAREKGESRLLSLLFELLLNHYEMDSLLLKKRAYIRMGVLVEKAVMRVNGVIYPEVVLYYGDEEHEIKDKAEDVEIVVSKGVREK